MKEEWVQFLVKKLRPHMPHGQKKKKNNQNKTVTEYQKDHCAYILKDTLQWILQNIQTGSFYIFYGLLYDKIF